MSATLQCRNLLLKVVSRCNLNCTYCYMYNGGDETYKKQPKFMSDEVVDALLGEVDVGREQRGPQREPARAPLARGEHRHEEGRQEADPEVNAVDRRVAESRAESLAESLGESRSS